jgi:hypothetical protein
VPGKYVAGTMAPAGAALDRPGLKEQDGRVLVVSAWSRARVSGGLL